MQEIVQLITHAIFSGTCVLVPLLFILHILKIKISFLDNSILVQAVNWTLLMGSSIVIAWTIVEIPLRYYSGGEYEQYVFTNQIMGPYSFYFWLFGPFIQALISQVLWVKRFRSSIICSAIIVAIWILLFMTGLSLAMDAEWNFSERLILFSFLKDGLTYMMIISAMYFVLGRRTGPAKN